MPYYLNTDSSIQIVAHNATEREKEDMSKSLQSLQYQLDLYACELVTTDHLLGYIQAMYDGGILDNHEMLSLVKAIAKYGSTKHYRLVED